MVLREAAFAGDLLVFGQQPQPLELNGAAGGVFIQRAQRAGADDPVIVEGDENVVTITPTGTRFFRLTR